MFNMRGIIIGLVAMLLLCGAAVSQPFGYVVGPSGGCVLVTGSGGCVGQTSPTLITPVLGVATGTSLALGGATIGSNALAVTGTSQFNNDTSIASAATNGLMAFNTADQTTNYERLRYYFSGNVANIRSENGGTGTLRDLQLGTTNFGITIAASSGSTGVFRFAAGASGGGNDQTVYSGSFTAGSGANNVVRIGPTVAQTSTAGIDMLRIAPTLTSTGSGGCNLVNGLGGAAGATAEFNITCGGIPLFPNLATGTNADFVCYKSDGTLLIQGSACTISSMRFKTNINLFTAPVSSAMLKLPVVTFKLKAGAQNKDPNAKTVELGLLAEDVAKIMPICAIYETDMKTPKSYRQECLIAALVKTVQEQHAANDNLARRVAVLERRR